MRRTEAVVIQTYYVYGVLLITSSSLLFICSLFTLILSKMLPESGGHAILDAIRQDQYYCYLLPLTIPTSVVFIYANWASMKFFRHN